MDPDDWFSILLGGQTSSDYAKERFRMTKEDAPGYARMRELAIVLGTWDDHDFGANDADRTFPLKDENRELFLDFIDEPEDSERRMQKHTPIHQDYFVTKGGKTVHIILLDGRYEYDREAGDRLGSDQWEWLELAFKRGKQRQVALTVIGSGTQVIPGSFQAFYCEEFRTESRMRLYKMMKENEIGEVVIISGDVHFAKVY